MDATLHATQHIPTAPHPWEVEPDYARWRDPALLIKSKVGYSLPNPPSRLGISARTYLEYLRGTNSPVGMRVVLDLLCMLDDQSAIQVIQHWRDAQKTSKQTAPEATT